MPLSTVRKKEVTILAETDGLSKGVEMLFSRGRKK
jgi:hypothetical protein